MQTLKTYIKKVKILNPITLFKNYLNLFERLEHRVDNLENQTNIDDVEQRVENIEYDLEGRIESVEDRSETNQESISILKDKLNEFHNNYKEMNGNLGERLMEDFGAIKSRFETLESETSTKKIREIVSEVLCDKGLQLNLLDDRVDKLESVKENLDDRVDKLESDKDNLFVAGTLDTIDDLGDRVDNLEELAKKYLKSELQSVALKQERTEENLSAIQKLSFEICKYYGGDFNLNDFNNCYEIINKYNVKEVK